MSSVGQQSTLATVQSVGPALPPSSGAHPFTAFSHCHALPHAVTHAHTTLVHGPPPSHAHPLQAQRAHEEWMAGGGLEQLQQALRALPSGSGGGGGGGGDAWGPEDPFPEGVELSLSGYVEQRQMVASHAGQLERSLGPLVVEAKGCIAAVTQVGEAVFHCEWSCMCACDCVCVGGGGVCMCIPVWVLTCACACHTRTHDAYQTC